MKVTLLAFSIAILLSTISHGQDVADSGNEYRNFPIILSVQFQNFALPFKDLGSNFTHVGIGLGTEVSFNGKQNWVQQVQAGYYFNNEAGNGFFTYTQTVYRPTIVDHFYAEVKAGIGWHHVFHPVDAFVYENGNINHVAGGKSQLIIPIGISLSYDDYSEKTYLSPFISYQVTPALFYNDDIPLSFYSLFEVGTRIHLSK
jgi:hypothetical protein